MQKISDIQIKWLQQHVSKKVRVENDGTPVSVQNAAAVMLGRQCRDQSMVLSENDSCAVSMSDILGTLFYNNDPGQLQVEWLKICLTLWCLACTQTHLPFAYKYRKEINNPAWPIHASSMKVLNQVESASRTVIEYKVQGIHPHQNTQLLPSMSILSILGSRINFFSTMHKRNYFLEILAGSNELYQPDMSESWLTVCWCVSLAHGPFMWR